jgi:hypothetical protein
MSDVPAADSGLGSGMMMTGHEVGAALGVALLTAVGGDLSTRAGLVAGHPHAFGFVAALLVALLVVAWRVPAGAGRGAHGQGHGHGHGHH